MLRLPSSSLVREEERNFSCPSRTRLTTCVNPYAIRKRLLGGHLAVASSTKESALCSSDVAAIPQNLLKARDCIREWVAAIGENEPPPKYD
jgi:hypothetical protein